MPESYSLAEALDLLSIPEDELRGLMFEGIVRAVRAGEELRFNKEDVDRFRQAWAAR